MGTSTRPVKEETSLIGIGRKLLGSYLGTGHMRIRVP
jgi:hypothetical protein